VVIHEGGLSDERGRMVGARLNRLNYLRGNRRRSRPLA